MERKKRKGRKQTNTRWTNNAALKWNQNKKRKKEELVYLTVIDPIYTAQGIDDVFDVQKHGGLSNTFPEFHHGSVDTFLVLFWSMYTFSRNHTDTLIHPSWIRPS